HLPFAAHNNLFRGGLLQIEPIPTSPIWEFKDNLFDKAVFEQDSWNRNLPLSHDYNAYWPRLDGEKEFSQAARLSPSGANDVVLTVAPAYQTSTFGDKYLTSTTPTLVNVGSRSPADAQLYHFTTNPNQTKDGDQAKVNIGRHYVAANLTTALPKDLDADGI